MKIHAVLVAAVIAATALPSFAQETTTPPEAQSPPPLTSVSWLERPSGMDFATPYPSQALRENVQGSATLDCLVDSNGRLTCTVVREDPAGYGFGEASLQVARKFRMAAQTSDGRPTEGGRVRIPMRWVVQ